MMKKEIQQKYTLIFRTNVNSQGSLFIIKAKMMDKNNIKMDKMMDKKIQIKGGF